MILWQNCNKFENLKFELSNGGRSTNIKKEIAEKGRLQLVRQFMLSIELTD